MAEKPLTDDGQKAASGLLSKKKPYKALFSFSRNEVKQSFDGATRVARSHGFMLLRASGTPEKHGKLLIIIPKRSGNACKRNRLRRQLKAIFYEEQLYQKPVVSILIAYPQAMERSFDEIKDFLVSHLR